MGQLCRGPIVKRAAIRPKRGATRKTAHAVLVNKKTDKVSSSSDWLNVERAKAFINGEIFGLPALMVPRGRKLLIHNKLATKDFRTSASVYSHKLARLQAKQFIVVLAVLYEKVMPKYKLVTRQDFVKWVVKEMANQTSEAHREATRLGFDALLHKNRSTRWWIDRLNKLQS